MTVAAIIPTIAPRKAMLADALRSVRAQTRPPREVVIQFDEDREGPAVMRNRAAADCTSTWLAFLDDDDVWYPEHLEACVGVAETLGVDVVYPWFHLVGADGEDLDHKDPLYVGSDRAFGRPFDAKAADWLLHRGNFIPVTAVVRREAFCDVGGFPQPCSDEWPHPDCEDWGLWHRLVCAGATFAHVPERTWEWRWHGKNTSGRTDRW